MRATLRRYSLAGLRMRWALSQSCILSFASIHCGFRSTTRNILRTRRRQWLDPCQCRVRVCVAEQPLTGRSANKSLQAKHALATRTTYPAVLPPKTQGLVHSTVSTSVSPATEQAQEFSSSTMPFRSRTATTTKSALLSTIMGSTSWLARTMTCTWRTTALRASSI
jgi:hypothetical protein